MRYNFANVMTALAKRDKRIIFLTGDLGFNFFEELRDNLQERFINAGVAEQNMVTVAAGLAYTGWKPWIFSISPFVTIKILEHLRNDICFSKTNVKVVGLGGGYDYEFAGPTHHSLEDIGSLLILPHMKVYVPAVTDDLKYVVAAVYKEKGPAYIRLTRDRKTNIKLPAFDHFRQVKKGDKVTLIALGSIIDKAMEASLKFNNKIDLWVVGKLPVDLPKQLKNSLTKTRRLIVLEEHCLSGGLGQHLSQQILSLGIKLDHFIHLYAKGYLSGRTGNRDFYLKESKLDASTVIKTLKKLT